MPASLPPLPPPDALDETAERPIEAEGTQRPEASKPTAGLYLTAVPIGNAGDITVRALHTLAAADAVYCEDTRTTRRLFAIYGLATRLAAYHEHNAARVRPAILARLARGEAVALVSDAGMPLISDPGYKLVREALAAGHAVTCLPGASAPLTALVISGMPTDRFLFAGFPPPRTAARRRFWRELAAVPASLVAFETAPRLAPSLADAAAELGDRPAAVARELTKAFEEVRRGRLVELAEGYRREGPPRGEVTLVIAGAASGAGALDDAAVDAALREALSRASLRDAAAEVAAAAGRPKREVYRRALALGGATGDASRTAEDADADDG